jgi:peroxiredoxin (alkyl hydroperoxide reductase subunit C)
MNIVGKSAPEWSATAYLGGEEKGLTSRDLAGRWYVLYFYPRDFTFVCPTEIRGFQDLERQFQDDRVAVLGVSTDSFFSHKAWLEDRKTFPEPITHPVIADTGHHLSRAFGVLREEDGSALRATVVVDDRGIVRSMSVNDTQVGRSPAEVLRTVQAFLSGGLCGAGWKKGDRFAR